MFNNMNNMDRMNRMNDMDRMGDMDYVKNSLETNAFFLRIMKEHLYFAGAAFTLKNVGLLPMIMELISHYDELLMRTISLSEGILGPDVIQAGDIITPYTLRAEMKTQQYVGLPINTNVTTLETRLTNNNYTNMNDTMIEQSVSMLNQEIMDLVKQTIQIQQMVADSVTSCNMFLFLYPTLLHHVGEEAKHYLDHLQKIQSGNHEMNERTQAEEEVFWNDKMMEHAEFLHSFLDPNEPLYPESHDFVNEFSDLVNAANDAINNLELLPQVTQDSKEATTDIRDYKVKIIMNDLQCQLKSMAMPLFVDHLLREANHFLKHLSGQHASNNTNNNYNNNNYNSKNNIKYYG